MLNKEFYQSYKITSWCRLIIQYYALPQAEDSQRKKWIFRGQARRETDKDDFVSSLERVYDDFGVDHERYTLRDIEKKLQREFRRRLHHYTSVIPEEGEDLELWALMQHYGAPTRLLDWTYSFFAAAFFATEFKGDWYEVWALNSEWFSAETVMGEQAERLIQRARHRAYLQGIDVPIAGQQAVVEHLISRPRKLVYNVNPLRLNERLTVQQGVFLFPGDINCASVSGTSVFEQNLSADAYQTKARDNLVRFKIDPEARTEILRELHKMNISRATLFPGLSGFAESLKTRLADPGILGG